MMMFSPSHQLVLLFLVSVLSMGGSFLCSPGRPSTGPVRSVASGPICASVSKVPSSGGLNEPSESKDDDTRKLVGDASLKKTTTDSLAKLGAMVNAWDDQVQNYLTKHLGVTAEYLKSIENKNDVGQQTPSSSPSGGPPTEDDDSKNESKARTNTKADGSASSAAVETPITAAAKIEDDAAPTTDVASTTAEKTNTKNSVEDATSDSEQLKGSAEGTVQLDRPKQVQSVFDDFQKKAVEFYNSSPVAKATEDMLETKSEPSSDSSAVSAARENAQKLEARLESLLELSSFRPRKLAKAQKHELVDALEAMEAAYPDSAKPLEDPSLHGQWSVVYTSRSRVMKRMVKGVFTFAFKTSQPRQVVDSAAAVVINACRARLRLTPVSFSMAQKGPFKATADRKVTVEFSPRKRGRLGRFLPALRSGKAEAEVTYLSSRWRICRVEDVTVAFRKNAD